VSLRNVDGSWELLQYDHQDVALLWLPAAAAARAVGPGGGCRDVVRRGGVQVQEPLWSAPYFCASGGGCFSSHCNHGPSLSVCNIGLVASRQVRLWRLQLGN